MTNRMGLPEKGLAPPDGRRRVKGLQGEEKDRFEQGYHAPFPHLQRYLSILDLYLLICLHCAGQITVSLALSPNSVTTPTCNLVVKQVGL